jgi:hypothetical protein
LAGAAALGSIFLREHSTVGTTTTISSAPTLTSQSLSGDFVQDVTAMAERIDLRLRMTLTPHQYSMVQDLVLATRITTIARDADDDLAESSAA